MRRLGKRLGAMVRHHLILTGLAAIAIGLVAGGLWLSVGGGSSKPAAPVVVDTYTFSADWTLLDLERHIDAGEVATIYTLMT